MDERLHSLQDRELSRRELLGIGAALFAVHGTRLDVPPVAVELVNVDGRKGKSDHHLQRYQTITKVLLSTERSEDNEGPVAVTPNGRLKFETSDQVFFYPDREIKYVHRTNDITAIDEAWEQGAELFDIDANRVGDTVYAEHGIIPQVNIKLGKFVIRRSLPVVLDANEKEFRLRMPDYTYEQLIAHIAHLKRRGRPLAVSAELKRGDFDVETLIKMLDIHREYDVPVLMHSPKPNHLKKTGRAVASAYGVLR